MSLYLAYFLYYLKVTFSTKLFFIFKIPLRVLSSALPAAYRVIYIQAIRALTRGVLDVKYSFPLERLAKYAYYI